MTTERLETITAKLDVLRQVISDVWREEWSSTRKDMTARYLQDYIHRLETQKGRILRSQKSASSHYPG